MSNSIPPTSEVLMNQSHKAVIVGLLPLIVIQLNYKPLQHNKMSGSGPVANFFVPPPKVAADD